mmetsp:Transcript_25889/g.72219  ORF Transcript_25889/g.72219 Transcript_25889/m.72219 type:complete len:210 (+) Transcript_25889:448-1077(+)
MADDNRDGPKLDSIVEPAGRRRITWQHQSEFRAAAQLEVEVVVLPGYRAPTPRPIRAATGDISGEFCRELIAGVRVFVLHLARRLNEDCIAERCTQLLDRHASVHVSGPAIRLAHEEEIVLTGVEVCSIRTLDVRGLDCKGAVRHGDTAPAKIPGKAAALWLVEGFEVGHDHLLGVRLQVPKSRRFRVPSKRRDDVVGPIVLLIVWGLV